MMHETAHQRMHAAEGAGAQATRGTRRVLCLLMHRAGSTCVKHGIAAYVGTLTVDIA